MSEVTEHGDIYFLYRPRVEREEVDEPEEVQRLYVVLKAWDGGVLRLVVVPRKRLPEATAQTERLWGFVSGVYGDPQGVRDAVRGETYRTRTRGKRVQPAARPAAAGAARHGDHTHLAYELELPDEPGEPQQQLNLAPQASLVISVKNPDVPSPPGAGLPTRMKPDYPHPLRERFGNRRFIAVDPPGFLDHEGAELVLVGATEEAAAELGVDLESRVEASDEESVLADLRIGRGSRRAEPLLAGEWE